MTKTNLRMNGLAALLFALFFGVASGTSIMAQTGNTGGTGTTTTRTGGDDDTDWGWIGLLGLAGLLGLMPKKRAVDNDYRSGNNR
jgi:LPXTG-motif cell wall-anchored protein